MLAPTVPQLRAEVFWLRAENYWLRFKLFFLPSETLFPGIRFTVFQSVFYSAQAALYLFAPQLNTWLFHEPKYPLEDGEPYQRLTGFFIAYVSIMYLHGARDNSPMFIGFTILYRLIVPYNAWRMLNWKLSGNRAAEYTWCCDLICWTFAVADPLFASFALGQYFQEFELHAIPLLCATFQSSAGSIAARALYLIQGALFFWVSLQVESGELYVFMDTTWPGVLGVTREDQGLDTPLGNESQAALPLLLEMYRNVFAISKLSITAIMTMGTLRPLLQTLAPLYIAFGLSGLRRPFLNGSYDGRLVVVPLAMLFLTLQGVPLLMCVTYGVVELIFASLLTLAIHLEAAGKDAPPYNPLLVIERIPVDDHHA